MPSVLDYPNAINGALDRKKDHVSSSPAPARTAKKAAPVPSRFTPKCHPLSVEVIKQVDEYFLNHWPFKNDKARKKFVAAGFSYVTCLYFPMAKDDRIHFACRLLTLLFLIDGRFGSQVPAITSLTQQIFSKICHLTRARPIMRS